MGYSDHIEHGERSWFDVSHTGACLESLTMINLQPDRSISTSYLHLPEFIPWDAVVCFEWRRNRFQLSDWLVWWNRTVCLVGLNELRCLIGWNQRSFSRTIFCMITNYQCSIHHSPTSRSVIVCIQMWDSQVPYDVIFCFHDATIGYHGDDNREINFVAAESSVVILCLR